MPTYQYKREDGTTFEIIQKISDEALKTCPQTGQKVRRVITGGGGVVYKGSGWYVTDYKNKSNGNGSGAQKASGGDSSAKASGKAAGATGANDSSTASSDKAASENGSK